VHFYTVTTGFARCGSCAGVVKQADFATSMRGLLPIGGKLGTKFKSLRYNNIVRAIVCFNPMRTDMKKFLIVLPIIAGLSACETQEQRQLTGTLAGAAIGASVSNKEDKAKGVIIGGLAGLAAGTLVGGSTDAQGNCLYERPDGSRYYASC
jgi:uncharacterized protein YcfJ